MRFEQAVDEVKQRFAAWTTERPETVAARLLQDCVTETHCTGAGISLMTESGARAVLAATDEVALRLQEIQFNFGEGPCTVTMDTRSPALQSDLASDTQEWSLYRAGALALGVAAVFAFPLRIADVHLGALELYRTEPGSLSSQDHFRALMYAQAALDLLVQRQAGEDFLQLYPYLTHALDDRIEVYHAVGMIAVQAKVGLDDALSLLRGHAFARYQTVMEAALDVVDGGVVFGSDPRH